MKKSYILSAVVAVVIVGGVVWASMSRTAKAPIAFLPNTTSSAQAIPTIPSNGDTNPYGVAFVPSGFPSGGTINPGDILVSNWNNTQMQGAGTTLVSITPTGQQSLFFQGEPGLGLTTALEVLKSGFV